MNRSISFRRIDPNPVRRARRRPHAPRQPAAEPLEPRAYLSAATAAAVTSVAGLSFAAPLNTVTVPGVVAATAGDFNGDGHTDLALLGEGGSSNTAASGLTPSAPTGDAVVSVLLGRGDGTFLSPVNTLVNLSNLTNLSGAGGPVFLGQPVVGDFNSDGRADLALAIQGNLAGASSATFAAGGAVVVLPGNGNGTFGPPQLVSNTPGLAPGNTSTAAGIFSAGTFSGGSFTGGIFSGGAFFTPPTGAGVVSIGSTAGIAFIPSGTAGGFVVASPGVGVPGSGTLGPGTFGSGNVFGGPVDNGGSSFGDASGAFVATGLPTSAGGTALGVVLGGASSPILTGVSTSPGTVGTPLGNESSLGLLPTFNSPTVPTPLGALPTFGTPDTTGINTTGINTIGQIRQPVGVPLQPGSGAVALATGSATGAGGPIVPTGAVAATPGGELVLLEPVNFGAAGTLAGVPGFTSFPGGLPVGFSAAGPFAVAGDFNGDGRADLAVIDPAAGTASVLLNTTAASRTSASRESAALAGLLRPRAAAGPVQFIPAITAAPATLSLSRGAKTTVTVRVTNEGPAAAAAPVTLQLFASADQAVEPGQKPLVTIRKKLRLKAGRSKSIRLKIGRLSGLAAGSYYLVAQVTEPGGSVAVAPAARPTTLR